MRSMSNVPVFWKQKHAENHVKRYNTDFIKLENKEYCGIARPRTAQEVQELLELDFQMNSVNGVKLTNWDLL